MMLGNNIGFINIILSIFCDELMWERSYVNNDKCKNNLLPPSESTSAVQTIIMIWLWFGIRPIRTTLNWFFIYTRYNLVGLIRVSIDPKIHTLKLSLELLFRCVCNSLLFPWAHLYPELQTNELVLEHIHLHLSPHRLAHAVEMIHTLGGRYDNNLGRFTGDEIVG